MAAVINPALPATVYTIQPIYGAANEVSGGVKTRSVGTMTGLPVPMAPTQNVEALQQQNVEAMQMNAQQYAQQVTQLHRFPPEYVQQELRRLSSRPYIYYPFEDPESDDDDEEVPVTRHYSGVPVTHPGAFRHPLYQHRVVGQTPALRCTPITLLLVHLVRRSLIPLRQL
jgi:hypothetical protein